VLTSSPALAELLGTYRGAAFVRQAESFDELFAYATGGGRDVWHASDGSGADLFVATPYDAVWYGDGFLHGTRFFEEVHAYDTASGDRDEVRLYDGPNDDTFTVDPDVGTLAGTRLDGATYSIETHDADALRAFATRGGRDEAHFTGSSADNIYYGTPAVAIAWDGPRSYWARADFFEQYYGYANGGGYDLALLYGGTGSDDYYGSPTEAIFSSPAGWRHHLRDYEEVEVHAVAGGTDEAVLVDSAWADFFTAQENWGKLYGTMLQYMHKVIDFGHVTVDDSGGSDTDGDTKRVVDPLSYVLQIDGATWADSP
jgi:hypothetical protein